MEESRLFSFASFVFIIYIVIATGFISDVLSKNIKQHVKHALVAKYVVLYLLIFSFIMLEGGWSFDPAKGDDTSTWKDGNALHSLVYALAIFLVIVVLSISSILVNALVVVALFATYVMDAQRRYWRKRGEISEATDSRIRGAETALLCIAAALMAFGVLRFAVGLSRPDSGVGA